jgi:hypothetical protein
MPKISTEQRQYYKALNNLADEIRQRKAARSGWWYLHRRAIA